jgi:hypothetical protein
VLFETLLFGPIASTSDPKNDFSNEPHNEHIKHKTTRKSSRIFSVHKVTHLDDMFKQLELLRWLCKRDIHWERESVDNQFMIYLNK